MKRRVKPILLKMCVLFFCGAFYFVWQFLDICILLKRMHHHVQLECGK